MTMRGMHIGQATDAAMHDDKAGMHTDKDAEMHEDADMHTAEEQRRTERNDVWHVQMSASAPAHSRPPRRPRRHNPAHG